MGENVVPTLAGRPAIFVIMGRSVCRTYGEVEQRDAPTADARAALGRAEDRVGGLGWWDEDHPGKVHLLDKISKT